MHESVFANQIIEEASKKGEVKSIVVEVGDLAHLPGEDLKQALEDRVNWKIKIEEKKAKVKCSCGYEGEPEIVEKKHDFTLFKCPKCGSIPEILDGQDIILKEVECA